MCRCLFEGCFSCHVSLQEKTVHLKGDARQLESTHRTQVQISALWAAKTRKTTRHILSTNSCPNSNASNRDKSKQALVDFARHFLVMATCASTTVAPLCLISAHSEGKFLLKEGQICILATETSRRSFRRDHAMCELAR